MPLFEELRYIIDWGLPSLSLPTNLRTMVWYCCYCIYRCIHGYVVIMMFEFREYCFIKLLKWKFKFWSFLSENSKFSIFDLSKLSLDRSKWQENNPRASEWIDRYSISIWLIKRALDWSKGTFDWSKVVKQDFLQNFIMIVMNVWRCIKLCERFYEKFWLSIHAFDENNPIGRNRG